MGKSGAKLLIDGSLVLHSFKPFALRNAAVCGDNVTKSISPLSNHGAITSLRLASFH